MKIKYDKMTNKLTIKSNFHYHFPHPLPPSDGPTAEHVGGSPGSNQEINSATLRFKLEPSPMETNGMSCITATTEGSSDRVTVKQELEQVIKALSQGEETPT